MKRILLLLGALIAAVACENNDLDYDNKEELVVEGWIENGHAPVVLISSSLPVSSTPKSINEVTNHILRYAEVYIEHNGVKNYLTARLTNKYKLQNYFTSSTLRGEVGETYTLHVKWDQYEATAVCTIPEPPTINAIWCEKVENDSSYIVKTTFANDPAKCMYYNSFWRLGDASDEAYEIVAFSSLDGSDLSDKVTYNYSTDIHGDSSESNDFYFHSGDEISIKLVTEEECMYKFWSKYFNISTSTYSSVMSSHSNLTGNISGGIGYWAGYGIDVADITIP